MKDLPAPELLHQLAIDELHDSPTNPRKTYGELAELAESVKRRGIEHPLIVRPLEDGYEIVHGHRRRRAATIAKLATAPCIVRELTDAQVIESQLLELCQREDVHPLEEADGYRHLHERCGYSVEDLAVKVDKSASWVHGRLQLCRLGLEARDAFLAGKLTITTALLVASIPAAELQRRAVEEITTSGEYIGRNGNERAPMSTARARLHVRDNYQLRLADAPFSKVDAEIVPEAGACAACPKRSTAQRELFPDLYEGDKEDRCTDAACFAKKTEAARVAKITKAKASDREVLAEPVARKLFSYGNNVASGSGYVDLKDKCYEDPKQRTWKELLGKAVTPALVFDTSGRSHDVVPVTAAREVLKAEGHGFATKATSAATAGRQVDEATVRREREHKVMKAALRSATTRVVAAAEKREPGLAFWKLLVTALWAVTWHDVLVAVGRRRGWSTGSSSEDVSKGFHGAFDKLTEPQLRGLAVELVTGRTPDAAKSPFREACLLFKVDFKQELEQARAAEKEREKEARARAKAKEQRAVAAEAKALGKPVPGKCWICGCTETSACLTDEGPCSWANEERTLCSSCDAEEPAERPPATGRRSKAKGEPKAERSAS